MILGLNSGFIKDDNGKLLGINLGVDACTEHGGGIQGIREAFNLSTNERNFGVGRRIIREIPQGFILKKMEINYEKYFLLIKYPEVREGLQNFIASKDQRTIMDYIPGELLRSMEKDLVCAWDESSFGILAKAKYENEMRELHRAFIHKDIAIGMCASKGFTSGGLAFAIASRIPEQDKIKMYEADKDVYELHRTAKKTGIKRILESAGKEYYALSPRWEDEKKKNVVFWLNPMEQGMYNSGWFTLKDLKDWAKDKGKVIKDRKCRTGELSFL